MTIFLFGYLFALPIKKFVCDEEQEAADLEKERYFTLTLKFIGLVTLIMLWPNFSYTTALVDEYYLVTSINSLSSTASLSAEAFLQMIIGFCAAIGTTLGLRILGEKIIVEKFINTLLMVSFSLVRLAFSSVLQHQSSSIPLPRFSWECLLLSCTTSSKGLCQQSLSRGTQSKASSLQLWEEFLTQSSQQVGTEERPLFATVLLSKVDISFSAYSSLLSLRLYSAS
jgi:hypothetical protein